MRLQRVLEQVYHQPWLIKPSGHYSIQSLIERKLASVAARESNEELEPRAGWLDDLIVSRPPPSIDDSGVAHVHVMGAVGVGFSKLEKVCGNTDTDDLLAEVHSMIDKGATKMMAYFDSPGGMAGGTPEAAAELAKLEIPWFAYIGPGRMACSAACYLAAGADRIYAAPTAETGSIGVYMPWIDRTAAYDDAGLKVKLIKNKEGDLKGAGYPGTALSPEQEAQLQHGCQTLFDMFAKFVRDNRPGEIAADTMRGQSFFAAEAKQRNLIDGVCSVEAALRTLRSFKR
ncbi:MAG TPA: S49 family peptidase [Chthoniobacterales bacterium]|nr:S49 family peptidase [Chthoniobacterales bacterium]